jgi:undecaprenyl-diphosphatase
MSFFQAVFLAIVQGLTEFLPISSSGHLVIFQKLFGFEKPPVVFDILVHVGTLGAVFIFFRREILALVTKKGCKLLSLLVIGTLPAAVIGFLLEGKTDWFFNLWSLVGFAFLLTTLILFSTQLVKEKNKKIKDLKLLDVLIIGVFQALAILPGVSRSGSTISAGVWQGLEKEEAFNFSFYLAIPAILGALILKFDELLRFNPTEFFQGLVGMIVAGIVGYFSLKTLKDLIRKGKVYLFGFYCLVIGLLVLSL